MLEDEQKHPKKITINLTSEDYTRLLELSDKGIKPASTVARKLFLNGLDRFTNPVEIALDKMRG